jgi:FlaA1/EpsC-like NDP-sugar epimerase
MKKNIFKDKVILITGGTGYLGQALTEEILKYNPQSIRVFSRDEVKHHKFQEKFSEYKDKIRNFIGDVRDYDRLLKATREADIVIHAAALKRLDILEYNVEEAIKTDILGSLNVVNACLENRVEKAIMVSTDKACSPVNTYGACKFVSERIFSESNQSKGSLPTVFTAVRYGNVLESTGSVIPFFSEKINNGHKIPLTDKRMTRFIISPEEAVDLIFNAIKYGVGGEVFVPKLPAFKITDLIEILKENDTFIKEEKINLRISKYLLIWMEF